MEIMPSHDFNTVVGEAFDRELAPLGFENIKGRKWVHSGIPEIRRVFVLGRFNEYTAVCAWGFSLDFVPHLVAGHKVQWHRTPISARLDLSYDPIDYTRDPRPWQISRFDGRAGVAERVKELPRQAVAEAERFWNRVHGVADVAAVFEEWRTRPATRFAFENYDNAPLAFAFVLARLGRRAEAEHWFEQFCRHGIRPEAKAVLHSRLEAEAKR